MAKGSQEGRDSLPQEGRSPLRSLLSFVLMLIAIVAAVFLLRTYVITPYEVPTGSMETTIMAGDRVFSERISYYTREPQAGDVVTFQDPEQPGRTLVKRVIATAGQTVEVRSKDQGDGMLYIDGEAQSEPYVNGLPSYVLQTAGNVSITYPYTVPDGCVWVMGDNRTNSADSRYFGAVPLSTISGHVVATYWPLDRIGAIN